MKSSVQSFCRWGCFFVLILVTVIQLTGLIVPYWMQNDVLPTAYQKFLKFFFRQDVFISDEKTYVLHEKNSMNTLNSSKHNESHVLIRIGIHTGLWKWCADLIFSNETYTACFKLNTNNYSGIWKVCQAVSIVGFLIGTLATVCAGLEIYYKEQGIPRSGFVVLCSISCLVAGVATILSHGLLSTTNIHHELTNIILPATHHHHLHPMLTTPVTGWGFSLGVASACLFVITGISLIPFITATYPAYHRTSNAVV